MALIRQRPGLMFSLLVGALITVHLSFYIPWCRTHFWFQFFPQGHIHYGYQGLDFYALPRGAWEFFQGGTLAGNPLPGGTHWAQGEVSNVNVYHPFFTLTLGSLLQTMSPEVAKLFWGIAKFALMMIAVGVFAARHATHRNLWWAVAVLLLSVIHVHEVSLLQYQSLFNICLLFLCEAVGQNRSRAASLWLSATLLIKPVLAPFTGLLWLRAASRKIFLFTVVIVAACSVPFLWQNHLNYYLDHMLKRVNSSALSTTDNVSLGALYSYWTHGTKLLLACKLVMAALLAFFVWNKRVSLFHSIFTVFVTWLCFENFAVYEYHYTVLPFLFAYGLVSVPHWQNNFTKLVALYYALPSVYFFLILSDWGANTKEFLPNGWSLFVLLKCVPLFLFWIYATREELRQPR